MFWGKDRLVSPQPSSLDTLLCPITACSWESFWKVIQDKMAVLPSTQELDWGRGQLVSQPLVGIGNERNEGRDGELLGTGLKYSNEALGVRR